MSVRSGEWWPQWVPPVEASVCIFLSPACPSVCACLYLYVYYVLERVSSVTQVGLYFVYHVHVCIIGVCTMYLRYASYHMCVVCVSYVPYMYMFQIIIFQCIIYLLYIYIYLYHAFKCILPVYHAGHLSYVYPSCQVYSRLATHNIHMMYCIYIMCHMYIVLLLNCVCCSCMCVSACNGV